MRRHLDRLPLLLLCAALTSGALSLVAPQEPRAEDSIPTAEVLPLLDSPSIGPEDALVTIVEFSDFQCPYCKRASDTMKRITSAHDDVRVVFKHHPLAFHKQADEAARAAIAAGKQGKFWQMHDLLFRRQQDWRGDTDAKMVEYAEYLGLDVARFRRDYDDPALMDTIRRDQKLAARVGARGTPHFFVNGVRVSGAQPFEKFDAIIKEQRRVAKQAIASGAATRNNVHAAMVAKNYEPYKPPKPHKPPTRKVDVQVVPIERDDPVLGDRDRALVTIVEFSDFQCPFCSRASGTVHELKNKYGDQVAVVFKHHPLPFHKQADEAARAAIAAGKQGKFWQMHDKLFANQREWRGGNHGAFGDYAEQLGLDMKRFDNDYDKTALTQKIERDKKLAAKVGARGTPTFFINGYKLVGAQPAANFEQVIDEQLALARELQKNKKGLSGDALYEAATAANKKKYADAIKEAEAAKPSKPPEELDAKQYAALKKGARGAPSSGNVRKAKVVIYEFTDLQCPFCKRGAQTIEQVKKEYGDEVVVVSLQFPLAFHKQAEDAAVAALAAHEQGKFWQMRAALFEHQRDFRQVEIWVKLANDAGLDAVRFEKAFKDAKLRQRVKDDLKLGQRLGVRGTPTFFVNDRRVIGAQPISKFREVIDAELEEK